MKFVLLLFFAFTPMAVQAQGYAQPSSAYDRDEWYILDTDRCVRTSTMSPGMATPDTAFRWAKEHGFRAELEAVMMPGKEGSGRMSDIQNVRLQGPGLPAVDFFPSFHKCRVFGNVTRLYNGLPEMPPQAPSAEATTYKAAP